MDIPLDEFTLDAIDHALNASLTYERPDDAPFDGEGPWVVGADFTLDKLLDFLGGTVGRDPNEILIQPGNPELPRWAGAEIVEDTRVHYSERDLIRDLVAEVRRLRAASE